ncbi:hypothetical protein Pint_27602 [Pistacia integerrima]|uniref:Uncharacterized protein n=1 Tax=Pistacia integerrima TaxID=434235 RepID=A0ACC0YT72_9ROSI|nr:hypothetical protein Pint_27602 [Pistacia integerrima]
MTSFSSLLLCPTYTLLLIAVFHLLFSPVSPRGLLFEEKTRLGSIPPSCYNKCNQCHPCMAVQVPTLPGHKLAQAGRPLEFFDPSSSLLGNKYSNYKPLGWKCRCNGHFYNP